MLPHIARLAALASIIAGIAACDPAPAQPVGHVRVALSTVSGDGTVYSLPGGTALRVHNADFDESFPLDGDVPLVTIALPAGQYQATLAHPYGFTEDWVLTQFDGVATTTVLATLLSPITSDIIIDADTVTSLTLTFRVAKSEIVTFAGGTLDVAAEVDEVAAARARVRQMGEVTAGQSIVHEAAPASLDDWWPVEGDTFSFDIGGHVESWTPATSTSVCGDLVDAGYFSSHPAVQDLLEEAHNGTSPKACLESADGVTLVTIMFAHEGPATTPTLAALGPSSYGFSAIATAELPFEVYDGQSLDLPALDGVHAHLAFVGLVSLSDASGEWFTLELGAFIDLEFLPRLN